MVVIIGLTMCAFCFLIIAAVNFQLEWVLSTL